MITLVKSGATPDRVGEFAETYPKTVAGILGLTPKPAPEQDMQAMIAEAVRIGIMKASAPKLKKNVTIAGQRSSVTLRPELFEKLVELKGTSRAASATLNKLANGMPKETSNKSQWVEEQLAMFLQHQGNPASLVQGTSTHH